MSQTGPTQLTLGEIAAEAGLTPAALVQRFGSKRKLLLALAEKAAEAPTAMFAELRAAHESPLSALREYARCLAGMGSTPGALAHNLGYLQVDLTDPDFHRHTRAMAVATASSLASCWIPRSNPENCAGYRHGRVNTSRSGDTQRITDLVGILSGRNG